jgi:hypothetical protein
MLVGIDEVVLSGYQPKIVVEIITICFLYYLLNLIFPFLFLRERLHV